MACRFLLEIEEGLGAQHQVLFESSWQKPFGKYEEYEEYEEYEKYEEYEEIDEVRRVRKVRRN